MTWLTFIRAGSLNVPNQSAVVLIYFIVFYFCFFSLFVIISLCFTLLIV